MALYTVHLASGQAPEAAIFVKDGFSWPGFLFGPLWLAFNRLFLHALGILALMVVAGLAVGWLDAGAAGSLVLLLLPSLLVGFEGNNWRRWRLTRDGVHEVAAVVGHGDAEMERRALAALAGPARPAPNAAARGPALQGRDVLGLFPDATRP